ncbi:MAG: SpoIVB peptidase [Bacillota bacterium]
MVKKGDDGSKGPKGKGILGLMLILCIVLLCSSAEYQSLASLPGHVQLVSGQEVKAIMDALPFRVSVRTREEANLLINGEAVTPEWLTVSGAPLKVQATEPGIVQLEFRLLGLIPFHRLTVEALDPVEIMPGGHSIGVVIRSDGIMVIDHVPVQGSAGGRFPGREAGIRVGDLIMAADGQPVSSKDELAGRVESAGRAGAPLVLQVRRDVQTLEVTVFPQYDEVERAYRIGLLVRDGAAGVGTLTAYYPEKMRFVALGHEISDARSQQLIPMKEGSIVLADVSGISGAQRGVPGEKIGVFSDDEVLGIIDENTSLGLFGHLRFLPEGDHLDGPVRIALRHEVQPGPAEMVTVIRGEQIQRFAVEIERVRPQNQPEQKGMVVRITDPELIEVTGGIVQGMSGSPILQDGRFVGAVTHVFVNDPTRGYAVYAEWLARELGVLLSESRESPVPLRGIAAFVSR